MHTKTILIIALFITATLALLANKIWSPRPHVFELRAGTYLDQPIAPFVLKDVDGKAFSDLALRDGWHWLFFGYRHCPDICPITLTQLATINAELTQQLDKAPTMHFISLDPELDSPEDLRAFVARFDPSFQAHTGSQAQLKRLTASLGVLAGDPVETERGRILDHSGVVILTGPNAREVALFGPPLSSSDIVKDAAQLLQHHRSA